MTILSFVDPVVSNCFSNLTEQSGHCFCLGDDWEEIGVISPARDYVLVKVLRYTRSGDLSLIHPDVKPVGPAYIPKSLHSLLCE